MCGFVLMPVKTLLLKIFPASAQVPLSWDLVERGAVSLMMRHGNCLFHQLESPRVRSCSVTKRIKVVVDRSDQFIMNKFSSVMTETKKMLSK